MLRKNNAYETSCSFQSNYKTNKEKVAEKNDENIIIIIFGYLRRLRMLRERMRKEM